MSLSGPKTIRYRAFRAGTPTRKMVKATWRNTPDEAIKDAKFIGYGTVVQEVEMGSPVRIGIVWKHPEKKK